MGDRRGTAANEGAVRERWISPHRDGAFVALPLVVASRKAEILAELRRPAEGEGRHPAAALLTCVDERVRPEAVLGCDPGRLFCVRLAGHVVSAEAAASLELGVALGCRLVFVLGHTDCSAVRIGRSGHGEHFGIARHIRWATRELPWDASLDRAIEANVRHAVLDLRARLSARVEGGVLDLANGEIRVLE